MKDKYLNLLSKLDITRLTFAGWFASPPPPQTPVAESFPFSILNIQLLLNTFRVIEWALAHFPFRLASGACRDYLAMTCRFRMASSWQRPPDTLSSLIPRLRGRRGLNQRKKKTTCRCVSFSMCINDNVFSESQQRLMMLSSVLVGLQLWLSRMLEINQFIKRTGLVGTYSLGAFGPLSVGSMALWWGSRHGGSMWP